MAADNEPRRSNPLPWLLGLLTLGGAALFGLKNLPETPPPAKAPAESAKEEKEVAALGGPVSNDPLDVLRDYLRVESEPKAARSMGGLDFLLKSGGPSKPLADYLKLEIIKYEFLIATVPDPVDSKLPHEFDAVLEGIQRAFEARRFTVRASRMPWRRGRDSARSAKAGKASNLHQEIPGVLLFRKSRKLTANANPSPEKIALVCLVGESPISGIHKQAMTLALQAKKDLVAALDQTELAKSNADLGSSIRIIAPFFSGSQGSLGVVLQQWRKKNKERFRVISGSASFLSKPLYEKYGLTEGDAPETTVISNDLLSQGVLQYLAGDRSTQLQKDKSDLLKRVAILREANTAFGVRASSSHNDAIDLPFPMSISQLQVEQARTAKAVLPQTEFVEPKAPSRDMNQLDAIPPYDPETAASTAGQNLRAIMRTIDQARVRYVGIVATDTRDVVFLNRLLRKECPNVRVFTTEQGVALLHPEEAYHLRGMVIGSTYPLSPLTQDWTTTKDSPSRTISFPTQGSHGYYNAVLALCEKPEYMIGYHPPRLATIKKENLDRPPIWISVIGSGGRLVPLHCYTDYDDTGKGLYPPLFRTTPSVIMSTIFEDQAYTSSEPNKAPVFSIPVGVLFGSLGSAFAVGLAILALLLPRFWQTALAGLSPAEEEEGKLRVTPWVWLWRCVLLGAMLLFALPYTLPILEVVDACCGIPLGTVQWRHWAVFAGALFDGLGLTIVALLLVLRAGGWRGPGYKRESAMGFFVMAVIVFAAVALTWVWWISRGPAERFFLFVRSTDLAAGLSPLMPMALLAASGFAMAWFSLKQAWLTRKPWLECPYADLKIKEGDEQLKSALEHGYFCRDNWEGKSLATLLIVGTPLAILGLWSLYVVGLPSGEGRWWDLAIDFIFLLTGGAVVVCLARFLTLWSRLRNLMEEILRVPMVAGFERLPDEIRRLFAGYLYSQQPHDRQLAAVAWSLPELERAELDKQIHYPINKDKTPWLEWVFWKSSSQAKQEDLNSLLARKWLLARLFKKAQCFLTSLRDDWKKRPLDEAFGVATQAQVEKDKEPDESRQNKIQREQYIAAYVAMYLGPYFAQLRMLAYAFLAAAPLLLFAEASYPFQPDRPQLNVLVFLLGAAAIGTAYVLITINLDGLVSRIMRTTPNRFTPDTGFFSSVMTYVLPVLAIILLQVLGLFRFILEPIVALFQ
jgi:hypothetical protein